MLNNLETLVELARTGTMQETATKLKISQSAVSKRISAISKYYEREVIEKHGRKVELTQHGRQLVDRVGPLIQEVRSVFLEDNALRQGRIVVGVSEAILSSWGSQMFADIQAELPEVEFEFHTQRSPVVLDRIRSGELMVGLCTGSADAETDVQSTLVCLEEMVIIPSKEEPMSYTIGDPLEVITIESRSGAWASIEDDMRRLELKRTTSLESFFAAAQMARAGFGHGLVPYGVARTLNLDNRNLIKLGDAGLNRPVRFVARKSMYSRPLIRSFYELINQYARDAVA